MQIREIPWGSQTIIRIVPESFRESIWWQNYLSKRQRSEAIKNMLIQYYKYGIKNFKDENKKKI